ncbi:hypothetical protein ASD85_25035 [Rhizobium sp. Root651]|nr:hypothetical protein ASD85_25035 [Rhizobium sp. Root651]
MDEEAVQFLSSQVVDRFARGCLDGHPGHGGKVNRLELFGERLTSVLLRILMIATCERHNVFGTDQRASRHESGESVRLLRTYPELRLV